VGTGDTRVSGAGAVGGIGPAGAGLVVGAFSTGGRIGLGFSAAVGLAARAGGGSARGFNGSDCGAGGFGAGAGCISRATIGAGGTGRLVFSLDAHNGISNKPCNRTELRTASMSAPLLAPPRRTRTCMTALMEPANIALSYRTTPAIPFPG
jgi:hypothetical protein